MSTQSAIRISGKVTDSGRVLVLFNSLPGSDQDRPGHFLSIWEGNCVRSSSDALQTKHINTEISLGQHLFTGLSAEKDYMIGYGIKNGEGPGTICATMAVPAGTSPGTRLAAELSRVFVNADTIGTDFLMAQLEIPSGYSEKSGNNWIALFQGKFKDTMYSGTGVIAVRKNIAPQYQRTIVMKNIPQELVRFETYTLVLGAGLDASGNPDYSGLLSYHTFIIWK
ncbi:MAG TPA: hypothetical protein VGC08_06215 [Pedobacter sp.]